MKKGTKIIGYIINEQNELTKPEILHIGHKGNGQSCDVKIKANLQDSNPNRNHRLYKEDVLDDALSMPHIVEMIKTRNWTGEAGHPISEDVARQMEVLNSNVSHYIIDRFKEDGIYKGIIESAFTEMGKFLAHSVWKGSKIAFSMRGLGPIEKLNDGTILVKKPLKIRTYDWVWYPSHQIAYQQEIIKEGGSINFEFANRAAKVNESSIFVPVTEKDMQLFLKEQVNEFDIITDELEIQISESAISLTPKKIGN